MRAALQRVGNSQGLIIPKPILAQVGFEREVDIDVEDGTIVLRKPHRHPREGWAEASRALAATGDDALVWPELPNEDNAELIRRNAEKSGWLLSTLLSEARSGKHARPRRLTA